MGIGIPKIFAMWSSILLLFESCQFLLARQVHHSDSFTDLMRELFSLLPLQQGKLFRLDSFLFVPLCSCQLVLPFDKFCIGTTLVVLSLSSSSSRESCSFTHTCTDWCGFVLLHFISADFNGKCFPNSILMLFYVRTARLAGVGNFECDCTWSDELCMFSCLELFFIRLEPTEQEHRK